MAADWGAAVAAPGWPGMDVNLKDSISFMAYSDSELDSIDLPKIYIEDLTNTQTPKYLLADYSGNISAQTWNNIKIPLNIFKNNPGDADLTKIKTIYFGQSVAENTEHTLYLDDIKMIGNSALDSILNGKTNEELVLSYLESIQDNFSNDKMLVPAQEDNSGQTFNNALTAMAFILEGEKERTERILDFYSDRVDQSNMDLNKQNFYYNNEARGFYQNIRLVSEGTGKPVYSAFLCDRWMGDNAWLLFAYKLYEKKYGFDNKTAYSNVIDLIKNLMFEYFYDDPNGHGGFVRHGWRWGPKDLRLKSNLTSEEQAQLHNDAYLHETDNNGKYVGHEEGNIDFYASLKLCGENETANKIKVWLDNRMTELENANIGLPLDLYSWRSMAFVDQGQYYKDLVWVPENDSRFKKEIKFNNKSVTGFYSFADASIQNIWVDGVGHMSCAFYAAGNKSLGDFYSHQMDSLLVLRSIENQISYALPFSANTTGAYNWVDINKGFSSACAWYIFTKYGFNPFTLEENNVTDVHEKHQGQLNHGFKIFQNYPNPFNPTTKIRYEVPAPSSKGVLQTNLPNGEAFVQIKIYDVLGNEIATLVNEYKASGVNEVEFSSNLGANNYSPLPSGIYFYQLKVGNYIQTKKMVLLR